MASPRESTHLPDPLDTTTPENSATDEVSDSGNMSTTDSSSDAATVSDDESSRPKQTKADLRKQLAQAEVALTATKAALVAAEAELNKKKIKNSKLRPTIYEEPITITCLQEGFARDLRNARLPEMVYRCGFEKSGTLSKFVIEDCHVNSHRKKASTRATIKQKNAYQALVKHPLTKALTLEGLDRQLCWARTRPPFSSWVSVFNTRVKTHNRAIYLYHTSGKIARRPYLSDISMAHLEPAFFEATKKDLDEHTPVKIPIFVSAAIMPMDRSPITLEQLMEAKSEVWLSIQEVDRGGIKLTAQNPGQPEEWLAWGAIPEWRIKNVYPYDGKNFHQMKTPKKIRSIFSPEYLWDPSRRMWCNTRKKTNTGYTDGKHQDPEAQATDDASKDKTQLNNQSGAQLSIPGGTEAINPDPQDPILGVEDENPCDTS